MPGAKPSSPSVSVSAESNRARRVSFVCVPVRTEAFRSRSFCHCLKAGLTGENSAQNDSCDKQIDITAHAVRRMSPFANDLSILISFSYLPSLQLSRGYRPGSLLAIYRKEILPPCLLGGPEIAFLEHEGRKRVCACLPSVARIFSGFPNTTACSIANCCRQISPRLIVSTVYGLFLSFASFTI